METKIKVYWQVSIDEGEETISLESMNIKSIEEWNRLTHEEQEEKLDEAINNLPERVCLVVDKWRIKK